MEDINFSNNSKEKILGKIEKAKIYAFSVDLYKSLQDKIFQYSKKIDEEQLGEKMTNYYKSEIKKFEKIIENSSAHFDTLFDFKIALESLNIKKENVNDILAHENAHANKLEQLGGKHGGYEIIFLKTEKGFSIIPRNCSFYPKEWSEEKYIDVVKQVVKAPDEYGNSMSPDDIDKLNYLEGLKKK